MKLWSSGPYNIAWFKLADFVARGEKERALNVYKLLMHSIADEAFAYQLEGDILLSFHDYKAIDRYNFAAKLYKKNGNYQKAIAMYEHILLHQQDLSNLEDLLNVYELLGDQTKIIHTYSRFAILAVQTNNFELLVHRLNNYAAIKNDFLIAELYGYTFFALLVHDINHSQIETYFLKTLELHSKSEKDCQLTKFMAKLQILSEFFYEKAHLKLSSH
jgi:tetratricopeptide (TPR) repeat protein